MKSKKRMLHGLVYDRLADALDLPALYDLSRDLMAFASQGDGPGLTRATAAEVSALLERGWRRLGKNVLTSLIDEHILPAAPP
jgi:hypothetical protein